MKYKLALVMSAFCAFSVWTEAKVKLPAILSDGMVLQRERSVKIWGNADKGESVTVVFKKKKFSTVAGEDGKWLVELPPMKAGGPFEMIVNDIRLKNILVGDVWLCSGQSNMELTVGRVTDKFAEEIARDENPMIRYVKIPLGNDLHGPKDDLPGTDWMSLTEETAPSFSALAYFFAKDIKQKNTVMLIFSLIFYAWGEPLYILLLVGMAFADWYLTLIMSQYKKGSVKAKLFLGLTVGIDLILLGIFKYGSFILSNLKFFTGFPAKVPSIMLPIGISFYTFQLITYCVDVYRGDALPQRSFKTLLLYVSLFHQCIAGPIVRYKDVCAELENRRATQIDIAEGINRFTVGLAKKAIIANTCAALADTLLVPDGGDFSLLASKSALSLWVGVLAFTLQIYIDFSAYSDMAIGMGKMIGIHYTENFDYPYISSSVSEFWRRWHITLGSFFRDYLYIPLGGSRRGKLRTVLNLFIVWALTGLWHGASWNFVLWGLYFFIFIALEKLFLSKYLEKQPALAHIYLLLIVFFGWILFKFESVGDIWCVLKGMFGANGNAFSDFETWTAVKSHIIILLIAVFASTPITKRLSAAFKYRALRNNGALAVYSVLQFVIPAALLILSAAALVGNSYNPFLYFRF